MWSIYNANARSQDDVVEPHWIDGDVSDIRAKEFGSYKYLFDNRREAVAFYCKYTRHRMVAMKNDLAMLELLVAAIEAEYEIGGETR